MERGRGKEREREGHGEKERERDFSFARLETTGLFAKVYTYYIHCLSL